MKKTILIFLIAFIVLFLPAVANQTYYMEFLTAAIDVNNNIIAVHGGAFTSIEYDISRYPAVGGLTIWFTPAAPAAVKIEFEWSVSADGTNWSTDDETFEIAVNTDERAVNGVVRVNVPFPFWGAKKIRLERVVVGNGAGNCTAINAGISF